MLISIITSVYNCEKYVSEMIESILAQTYTDWELIIFDDASTDSTWDIVSRYCDSRIIKFRNLENKGLTVNLNKALRIASGTYIVRIDGDDIAYPRRLEKQLQFMNMHQDVVLSGCWMNGFGKKSCFMQAAIDSEVMHINLLFNAIVFHPTFIIKKDVLDLHQIKYNEDLKYAQDYALEYELSKYGKIKNIPEILMKYRFHDNQITIEKSSEQKKCADATRRLILDELGIKLSADEYTAWNYFGAFDCAHVTDDGVVHIENVVEHIISLNKIKRIYNDILLQQITATRLGLFKTSRKRDGIHCISTEEQNKYHKLFQMMTQWKRLNAQNASLDSFMTQRNLHSVAIYGMGHVGRVLAEELRNTCIEVKYGIDKNIEEVFRVEGMPIVTPQDDLENVDAIIVTAILQFESIRDMLLQKIACPIFSIEDVVYSM